MMGTYSFLTFCHICSRGESGRGGSGWCGDAENWRFHSLRCAGLGLSLACVWNKWKEYRVSGEESIVLRMVEKRSESLCGREDVSFCSNECVCVKWEEMVGNSRRVEAMARPRAWVWSVPMKDRKSLYVE